MAELHQNATLTPSKRSLIDGWMGSQRWYAAKGKQPRTHKVHSFRFDDPAGEVGVETMLVADDSGGPAVVYQVPLTYRGRPEATLEHALIGTTQHSVLGLRWVYDGCHDPVYAAQLLAVLQGRALVASSSHSGEFDDGIVGHRHPSWVHDATVRSSRVLTGEQSNTSVILDCLLPDGTAAPLICKVFRTVQDGVNPDVELQGALREAGCDRVPEVIGHLAGTWQDRHGQPTSGDLVFAQEFLPGVEDAWRVALRAVATDADFTAEAAALGAATAEVHQTLATTLGTMATTPQTAHRLVGEMRSRAVQAQNEVPALAAYATRLAAAYDAAEAATWPDLQRIHGDLHLGQVIHSPGRGWVLLDFEGEPLRPLAERAKPDQWIRDVAGMLRSFDYAGGSHERSHPGTTARTWVAACQGAFLDGYAQASGVDPGSLNPLLTAFLLDKAAYEVVYEARNRPTWLPIPLDSVQRLLAGRPLVPASPKEVST